MKTRCRRPTRFRRRRRSHFTSFISPPARISTGSLPFTNTRPDLNDATVPGDFGAGIAWLSRAQDEFIATVVALTDQSVFESRPAYWGELVPAA